MKTKSVKLANINLTEYELLTRAVKYAKPHEEGASPKWSVVGELFGLGSTSAHQLCRYAGVDPHEMMKGPDPE